VGLFGSLTRGDFDERSDIDIFVITAKEIPLREQDELYYAFSELIPRFGRDITVLVYDINGLKRIPTEEHGIVYDDQEKVFSLKRAERVVFSLEE